MDIWLLFRKKSPMTDEGIPWLKGAEEHSYIAKRNATGRALVSAVLVRALLACLDRAVLYAEGHSATGKIVARVRSSSAPSSQAYCALQGSDFYIPHGQPNKVTYHIGVLVVLQALVNPAKAGDFLEAYQQLLQAYQTHGRDATIRPALCRAADELYYLVRYGDLEPKNENDRSSGMNVASNEDVERFLGGDSLDLAPLTDPDALARLRGQAPAPAQPEVPQEETRTETETGEGFIGWQVNTLAEALKAGENILLAGPTGTGKTACFQQVATGSPATVIAIEGKEGLTDLDFMGAILPQPDGSRRWVDGPLLRAMRLAEAELVWLFMDEINRIPRRHVNLLLTLMNPKSGEFCQKMGLPVLKDGVYYVLEVPLTSEIVFCPVQHLRIIAAGNFGRAYAVYDLDPALRRRFETVVEFDYLESTQELALVQLRTGLSDLVARALIQLAQETRRLMGNGEMPGCIDTGSLLNWAGKCARLKANTIEAVMQAGGLTWADTVCGRDHQGRVNAGSFKALQDYLVSLGTLPQASGGGRAAARAAR
jgi:nitric oxide reductase NorQ protein